MSRHWFWHLWDYAKGCDEGLWHYWVGMDAYIRELSKGLGRERPRCTSDRVPLRPVTIGGEKYLVPVGGW